MESLYILIPIALLFIGVAVKLFFWAVKSGQYDDLDAEGKKVLFDEQSIPSSSPTQPQQSAKKEVETETEK